MPSAAVCIDFESVAAKVFFGPLQTVVIQHSAWPASSNLSTSRHFYTAAKRAGGRCLNAAAKHGPLDHPPTTRAHTHTAICVLQCSSRHGRIVRFIVFFLAAAAAFTYLGAAGRRRRHFSTARNRGAAGRGAGALPGCMTGNAAAAATTAHPRALLPKNTRQSLNRTFFFVCPIRPWLSFKAAPGATRRGATPCYIVFHRNGGRPFGRSFAFVREWFCRILRGRDHVLILFFDVLFSDFGFWSL